MIHHVRNRTRSTHSAQYAGHPDRIPDQMRYKPITQPAEWEITEVSFDQLPSLPQGARQLITAAHAAGQVWLLTVTDVPCGTLRHDGNPHPQVEVDLPLFDPRRPHTSTRWSWVDNRVNYRLYSQPPLRIRDALALLDEGSR